MRVLKLVISHNLWSSDGFAKKSSSMRSTKVIVSYKKLCLSIHWILSRNYSLQWEVNGSLHREWDCVILLPHMVFLTARFLLHGYGFSSNEIQVYLGKKIFNRIRTFVNVKQNLKDVLYIFHDSKFDSCQLGLSVSKIIQKNPLSSASVSFVLGFHKNLIWNRFLAHATKRRIHLLPVIAWCMFLHPLS